MLPTNDLTDFWKGEINQIKGKMSTTLSKWIRKKGQGPNYGRNVGKAILSINCSTILTSWISSNMHTLSHPFSLLLGEPLTKYINLQKFKNETQNRMSTLKFSNMKINVYSHVLSINKSWFFFSKRCKLAIQNM